LGLRIKHALWLATAAVVVGAVIAWYVLPVEDWIEDFTAWIARLGAWGILAFGLIYVLATLLLAPGSVMSVAAGVAFGYWGLPFVLVSATSGAALAFLLARYAAHDSVSALLEDKPKFKAVARAIDEEGWKIVALVRLSPQVPFAVTNYFFGVTNVGFWPFVITTALGVAPATFVYISIGTMGRAAAAGGVGAMRWIMLVVGLMAAVAAAVLIARKAREKLRAMAAPAQAPG
jgi:uncharacterized membrane protein YdjX (TVP38/TMEM64 family)